MYTLSEAEAARPDYGMRSVSLIALAVLSAGAGSTHAASPMPDAWYVAGAGTGSFLDKPHQTIANAPTRGSTLQVTNAVDFGWGGQFAAGRTFGPFRLEGEIGRTENKSKSYTATSPIQITIPQNGKNNVTRYMANGYYDLPPSPLLVRFYVGAGVGAADTRVTTFAAPARAPKAPPSQLLDFGRTVFAYQLIGGVSRQVTPHLALTLQYRWFDAGTIKGHDSRGERATRDIAGSNIDFGMRYRF